MKVLDTTSDTIKLVTASAGAIDVDASWSDTTGTGSSATVVMNSTITPQITTAATTTIVAAPASSHTLNLKFVSIRNAHATVANTVTVQHADGTNTATIYSVTLYPSDQLHYNEITGWQYIPASTSIAIPGRLLLTTIKTTGTSFTTGALTNNLRARLVGGGGGGGGCTSVAAAAAAAGGGGAGGYGEKLIAVSPSTAYTYAIGAAGTSNSAAAGGNGGDTTLTVGATTITAKGGTGGPGATASAGLTCDAGGAGGAVGTNGDINASGAPGEYGTTLVVATPTVGSGSGGSGPYGGGGLGLTAVGAGNAGTGNGSGGGGSATGASTARAGGVGTVGLIQFDEYA